MSENRRPSKRVKLECSNETSNTTTSAQSLIGSNGEDAEIKTFRGSKKKPPIRNGRKISRAGNGGDLARTFSQPSVICSGDRGIFVSSDKGREKNALLELHDLVQQHLEERGIDASGRSINEDKAVRASDAIGFKGTEDHGGTSIENDIASELAALKSKSSIGNDTASSSRPIQLITLDIPCVSLLRLPPGTSIDPVDVVHKICAKAADPATPQQGRYVKRLTPISKLTKVLSDGLEKLCKDIVPIYFGPNHDGAVVRVKFAIKPTIRNNDKIDRDFVIRTVAKHIQEVGLSNHCVDLKQYEKAVLVEVYRGWIGMCVVDNVDAGPYEQGFDKLKRFNLAEIYAGRSTISKAGTETG